LYSAHNIGEQRDQDHCLTQCYTWSWGHVSVVVKWYLSLARCKSVTDIQTTGRTNHTTVTCIAIADKHHWCSQHHRLS